MDGMIIIYFLAVCLLCATISSSSDVDSKIYFEVRNHQPCVQLANATHQIGCTSSMKGNRGVLHLINFHEDVDWLVNEGRYGPYVPLIDAPMFTKLTMDKLMKSNKISGALVILKNSSVTEPFVSNSIPSHPFSPDPSCPLDNFGLYKDHPEYKDCKKVTWNRPGNAMSFEFYGIPIFALSDHREIEQIKQCAERYNFANGTAKGYPHCSVELKDFMFAAKDTPTCKRKSELANPIMSTYCDPLGDRNVFGTLYPLVEELESDETIMLTTRLDSSGFFHDISPGADNGVTGIVTLLAVARALGDYKRSMLTKGIKEKLKPIMFTFFNGEVWDYIGSSRMVWDMSNGRYPYSEDRKDVYNGTIDDSTSVSKINMSNIGYFVELSQLGLDSNGGMFAHSDPISQKIDSVKKKVDTIMKYFKGSSESAGAPFTEVDRSQKQPLPPASFQRFLRQRKDIPGIVLTDHEKEFTNNFYNSRFDNGENLGLGISLVTNTSNNHKRLEGRLPSNLTKLATSIANAVYLLASDGIKPKEKIVVPDNLIADLLYCMLYSANCSAFSEINDGKGSGQFKDGQTYKRYVTIADLDNPITFIIHRLLSYYTGEWLKNCSGKVTVLPKALSYMHMQGNNSQNGSMICVRGTAYMTVAVSPAFELNDYTSTEYSTWTESMWASDIGIRIFLVTNPMIEGVVLASGIIMFVCSFGLTLFFKKQSTILFTPTPLPVIEISS